MRGSLWVVIWVAVTLLLGIEYLGVHYNLKLPSILSLVLLGKKHGISLKAGDSVSFFFGWLGFGLICLTNLYVIKKRFGLFESFGQTGQWLDFHIFCGLMGPTLILFHCDFKVRGLVAISFWSMMVSVASGVLGRYIYTQLLGQRMDIKRRLEDYEHKFRDYARTNRRGINAQVVNDLKDTAMQLAFGGLQAQVTGQMPISQVIKASLVGDLNIFFAQLGKAQQIPPALRKALKRYAVYQRKSITLGQFRILMGYWHTFHAPFAVFMYCVAIIHIISSLIFRVKG